MSTKYFIETLGKGVMILAAAILIPWLTGVYYHLTQNSGQSHWWVVPGFIGLSFITWEVNVRMMRQLRNKWYRKDRNVYIDFIRRILLHTGFTILFSFGYLSLVMYLTGKHDMSLLLKTCFAIVLFVIIVTCIYEIIYLTRERESGALKAEELNYARSQAELTALKNQIDPHFIFNSLNTLSHLIKSAPETAYLFNNNLATIYRYILINREKEFVLLKEELEFVNHHFYLFRIRYEKAVSLVIEIDDVQTEHFLIPPISLQLLVENAIKHNDFSDEVPMNIHILVNTHYVTVKNQIIPKKYFIPSSKIGLHNLSNRYRILTKKDILVEESDGYFIVRLPILSY